MNGNVHKSIVNSAAKMLPAELKSYLSETISQGEHAGKTRLELLLLGAVIEDDTSNPGPIPDPDLQNIPESVMPGDYWPWMEHFWNSDLDESRGLTITAEGLGSILGLSMGALGALVGGIIGENIVLAQFRSALSRALEYWEDHVIGNYNQGRVEDALICLGRVCHLLTDVGTPAHIHNDPHMNILGFDDDDYENYTSDKTKEYGDGMLPYEWDTTPYSSIVYNPDWDLRRYFRELGEISRLYDSDDVDGRGTGHPYHWDHYYDSLANILPIDRDITGDLTDMGCHAIASDLIPITIDFVAGVICYFFKTINFYISLDIMEVSVRRFHVYDDTDPCGSGEIFLKANLNNHPLYQIGGQYDLNSGHSTGIGGVDFSVALSDKNTPVHFYASAYDDDSTYFWDGSESLGNIDYVIDPSSLTPDSPQAVRVDSSGGSGSFGLDIVINFRERAQVAKDFSMIMNSVYKLTSTEALKVTRFKPKNYIPVIINLKTMSLHEYAAGGSRLCKRWSQLDDEKKLIVYMFKDELFEEVDGKTKLQRIVERKYGEGSKQYKWVKDVKDFKGYCACLRKGYPDKNNA